MTKAISKTGSTPNLASLSAIETAEDEGAQIDIQHPAGGPFHMGGQKETPLVIKVVGRHSPTYRAAVKAGRDRALKRGGLRLSAEEQDERELAILAACTLSWDGAFDDDGIAIPFNRENAVTLYRVGRFIAEQIDIAIGDHERFFPGN